MNIAIFTNNYKPIISGVTVSVDNFTQGLRKLGHRVFILAPDFRGHRDLDKNHFRYPSLSLSRKVHYPIPLPSNRAKAFCINNKIELIHSQHPWGVGKYAVKLARHLDVPIIFTNHTMYPLYTDYIPKILPQKLLMKLIEASAVRYANKVDAVIAPTDGLRKYLIGKGVTKPIYVVPSGVDRRILDSAPPAHLRKRFNIPPTHKLLLNLSRVGPEKNLPALLIAYKKILAEFPNTALVIAGGGSFLTTLQEIARDMGLSKKVFFTDTVQLEERGGYFREADIFVHSSLSETQGLVMVDSLMVGVPIVAMDAIGPRDIVQNEINGLITEPTPEALAEATLKLLTNDKLREKLAKGAIVSAREYTIDKTSERLEAVYQKLRTEN